MHPPKLWYPSVRSGGSQFTFGCPLFAFAGLLWSFVRLSSGQICSVCFEATSGAAFLLHLCPMATAQKHPLAGSLYASACVEREDCASSPAYLRRKFDEVVAISTGQRRPSPGRLLSSRLEFIFFRKVSYRSSPFSVRSPRRPPPSPNCFVAALCLHTAPILIREYGNIFLLFLFFAPPLPTHSRMIFTILAVFLFFFCSVVLQRATCSVARRGRFSASVRQE